MMHQVLKAFPDDKPITDICVIENPSKCLPGYYVVSRTHDQDSDADLWNEVNFFGRKKTRYLCLSKTKDIAGFVVENISVINEKENPPEGYCVRPKSMDTVRQRKFISKAWRNRQICFKWTSRNLALSAVTDIILLSRAKKAPDGFTLAGDINGFAVCFKSGPLYQDQVTKPTPLLGYSLNPVNNGDIRSGPVMATPCNNASSPTHDYENLVRPSRPAPPRPPPIQSSLYSTIASYHGLEGVPFVINTKLSDAPSTAPSLGIPAIKARTQFELDREYNYDFRLERQT